MKYGTIKNYSNGEFIDAKGELLDVISPLDETVIAKLQLSKKDDLDEIVEKAKQAQVLWGNQTMKQRVEVAYNYRNLLKVHREELARISHEENGKAMEEAYAEVDKAIELTEFACSIPQIAQGEVEEVSAGIVCETKRAPLGVVASIAPFNFPIMVPHWTIPNAMMMGNAMIIKPSELTPISTSYLAGLWKEAGLPDGIFNIFNGDKEAVEAICDHKDIQAVSFVGSTQIAEVVYKRSTASLKRSLALGGAKNYLIVAPDAHLEGSARDIIASSTGMSGQRCMAASVMVVINGAQHILDKVQELMSQQKATVDFGPLISGAAVSKIVSYLENAEQLGAKILVDGRKQLSDNSCVIGSSLIDWRGIEDKMPKEEIFGPVLEIIGAKNLEEALTDQHASLYGNAGALFTQNGRVSNDFKRSAQAGMLGINIGVPVPREPFSFGGIKASKFGFGDITGKLSLDFWSHLIKITTKWNPEDKKDWMS